MGVLKPASDAETDNRCVTLLAFLRRFNIVVWIQA